VSYVIASYGITVLAIGGYAWSLFSEHRRLRAEQQKPSAPDRR
jgi:heme exporter protein CcmD